MDAGAAQTKRGLDDPVLSRSLSLQILLLRQAADYQPGFAAQLAAPGISFVHSPGTQNTELTRGPPELQFSTFVYRRKSAACPKFDMVWLYSLPIPVGRRGVIICTCLRYAQRKGGEVGTLWGGWSFSLPLTYDFFQLLALINKYEELVIFQVYTAEGIWMQSQVRKYGQ